MTPELFEAASADRRPNGPTEVGQTLNMVLADVFALYLKTKSFHWHVSGSHFRDYHLLFDEQASQLLAITDLVAERVRKIGDQTLCSIGDIARHQRLKDDDATTLTAIEMLNALLLDNAQLVTDMREAHWLCDARGDVASAGLLETAIDEAEGRIWFLNATKGA